MVDNFRQYIEQMMKPYRDLQKITEPLIQFQKELNKSLEPLREFQKSFIQLNKLLSSLPKVENPFLDYVNTFKRIGELLKNHAENTPVHLLILAKYVWFVEFDCPISIAPNAAEHFNHGRIDNADNILVEYYSANIDRIFSELYDRHPDRKEILSRIYLAYLNSDYLLVIPCILTQIDGICFDFTKKKLFIKEKNNNYLPEVTSVLEKSSVGFLSLYLSPLQNQTPIVVREKDLKNFPCQLNRHEIMHGIRTDYGTRKNTLKVISLLKYISDLLVEIENKH